MSQQELTKRQRTILYAIVKEYCDSNLSIGSNELKEKYNFDFSSATIRNELVFLRENGYLYQPFKNSGSIPTEQSLKLFITILMDSLEFSTQQQRSLQNKVMELQSKQAELSKEIAKFLSDQMGSAAFALTSDSQSVKGTSHLLKQANVETVGEVIDFLENIDQYKAELMDSSEAKDGITMVMGGEHPVLPLGKGYALVSTKVRLENGQESVIGVISPLSLLAKKQNLALLSALNTAFEPKPPKKKK